MPAINTQGYHLASPHFETAQAVMDGARRVQRLRDLRNARPKPIAPTVIAEPILVETVSPAVDPIPTEPNWLSMVCWPKEITSPNFGYPSIKSVQEAFCKAYGDVTMRDMVSPSRIRGICVPRQLAMALAKHLAVRSLPEIGRMFGKRDHSTVIHAVRKMAPVMAATIAEVYDDAPLSVWAETAVRHLKATVP